MAIRVADRSILVALIAGLTLGCAPAAASPSTSRGSPTPSASPADASRAPSVAVASVEAGLLAFPEVSEVQIAPGRYRSQPPFDVPFTFEVTDEGWETGHLHGEFFDLLRDIGPDRVPGEWLAFAHPVFVGEEPGTPAAGLSPEEAVALLADRGDLTTSGPQAFSLDGRDGRRIDLHAAGSDSKVFGGPDGAFGMSPGLDLRLGAVPLDADLLLVLVLAPPDQLDQVWEHVRPILDSVEL